MRYFVTRLTAALTVAALVCVVIGFIYAPEHTMGAIGLLVIAAVLLLIARIESDRVM